MIDYAKIPPSVADGLVNYLELRYRPGSFLLAVLENNLKESFRHADPDSADAMHSIVAWLYNYAPPLAYGSPYQVAEWLGDTEPPVRTIGQLRGYEAIGWGEAKLLAHLASAKVAS